MALVRLRVQSNVIAMEMKTVVSVAGQVFMKALYPAITVVARDDIGSRYLACVRYVTWSCRHEVLLLISCLERLESVMLLDW
jgi:hypothetical protein